MSLAALTWLALLVGLIAGLLGARWSLQRSQGRALSAWGRLRQARREAQEAREEAQVATARLEGASEAVTDALLFIDDEGTVGAASRSAREWFDLRAGSGVSLMAAVRSEALVDVVEAALAGDTSPRTIRWRNQTFRAHAVPLSLGGAVLAVRDETHLERLARARRDLVSNVSHDLRTPLTAMGLLVETLGSGGLDDPKLARQLIDRLTAQIDTLNQLAQQLVDLERIESGHAYFKLEETPLRDLISAASASLRPQFTERGVKLEVDVDPELSVLADRSHVQRVITNLLDNALRHSPEGSVVRVGAQQAEEPDRIAVFVADEGPGMAPDELERVFERFYRSDPSRTGKGAGLGLAIARHIILGHGGKITADHAPGGGARFQFTLPAA